MKNSVAVTILADSSFACEEKTAKLQEMFGALCDRYLISSIDTVSPGNLIERDDYIDVLRALAARGKHNKIFITTDLTRTSKRLQKPLFELDVRVDYSLRDTDEGKATLANMAEMHVPFKVSAIANEALLDMRPLDVVMELNQQYNIVAFEVIPASTVHDSKEYLAYSKWIMEFMYFDGMYEFLFVNGHLLREAAKGNDYSDWTDRIFITEDCQYMVKEKAKDGSFTDKVMDTLEQYDAWYAVNSKREIKGQFSKKLVQWYIGGREHPIEHVMKTIDEHEKKEVIKLSFGEPLLFNPDYYWGLIYALDGRKSEAKLEITTNLKGFCKRPEEWIELFNHKRMIVIASKDATPKDIRRVEEFLDHKLAVEA